MTKLEEKLLELRYERQDENHYKRKIRYKDCYDLFIIFIQIGIKKVSGFLECCFIIQNQQTITNLQQAFNEMQKDLEILEGVENDK